MLHRFCRKGSRVQSLRAAFASNTNPAYLRQMQSDLKTVDPEMWSYINEEARRIKSSVCLIASENFTSNACLQALGTVLNNKYAEGYPDARYYGGCEVVDKVEKLTQKRALEAYGLNPAEWGVNVQALSGAPANMYVFYAVGGKDCRVVGPGLPDGGHLSHGYATNTRSVSATADYFRFAHYGRNKTTLMYENHEIETLVEQFKPQVIVAGYSAYCHHYDYEGLAKIAHANGAYLMADMAHISGLVSGGAAPNLFDFCDIVTTTTHKSLQCNRGAMIFYRKGEKRNLANQKAKTGELYDLEQKINDSVFPGHQGGPHMHSIAAIGVGLGLANTPAFKKYQHDVNIYFFISDSKIVANAQTLSDTLIKFGLPTVGGGTLNHIVLTDVKNGANIDGARVDYMGGFVNMTINKNVIPGGTNAVIPGGIRTGTPAMTARGCGKSEFEYIGELIHKTVQLANKFKAPKQKLGDFKQAVLQASQANDARIVELRQEVSKFANSLDYWYDNQLN